MNPWELLLNMAGWIAVALLALIALTLVAAITIGVISAARKGLAKTPSMTVENRFGKPEPILSAEEWDRLMDGQNPSVRLYDNGGRIIASDPEDNDRG